MQFETTRRTMGPIIRMTGNATAQEIGQAIAQRRARSGTKPTALSVATKLTTAVMMPDRMRPNRIGPHRWGRRRIMEVT